MCACSDCHLLLSQVLLWFDTASLLSIARLVDINVIDTPLIPLALVCTKLQQIPKDPRGEATMDVDQRAFRDGYEPAAGDVFIAILGVTGAGKVHLSPFRISPFL